MEQLRHHIIAICSLYRVNKKNSQEKNARRNVRSLETQGASMHLARSVVARSAALIVCQLYSVRKNRMNTGDFTMATFDFFRVPYFLTDIISGAADNRCYWRSKKYFQNVRP
jgi:hypothetical protein